MKYIFILLICISCNLKAKVTEAELIGITLGIVKVSEFKSKYGTFLIFENSKGGIEVIKVSDLNLTRKVPVDTLELPKIKP